MGYTELNELDIDVEYVEALRVIAEKARALVAAIFPLDEYDVEWVDLVDSLDKLSEVEIACFWQDE